MEPGSSVSIVSDYGLDDRAIGFRSPAEAKDFSSILCVQTGSEAHPASCTMGTGGPFPGGKARPGRDADHSPLSSAEVVNEYELYLLSPQAPPWRVEGLLYSIYYICIYIYIYMFVYICVCVCVSSFVARLKATAMLSVEGWQLTCMTSILGKYNPIGGCHVIILTKSNLRREIGLPKVVSVAMFHHQY
jgi:hypothetical protein